jgi:hypothetical protein
VDLKIKLICDVAFILTAYFFLKKNEVYFLKGFSTFSKFKSSF